MSNILILNQSFVFVGLGTLTFTIPSDGIYYIKCDLTEVPPSGIVVVINKNDSPIYTAPAVTPTQSAFQFKSNGPLALNDVITVVLSSASAIDSALNNVKSIISIGQGL